ncbi:uncharacterized protein LOC126738046 [Anthonomus grandis grandis]|uniref:uncharacterized protein LOC126738046 n=1 Tax=Anthonomus grandis grandis TaxID=2921223 RepID=UPI002165EF7A|nr:uncharacterized protein LOC126738046 [Anthonomus grandis grandis]
MTSRFRSASPPPPPPPPGTCCQCLHTSKEPQRPKSLMESLLVAKMETLGQSGGSGALTRPQLIRTDSVDSCSSYGSTGSFSFINNDYCRCDDCLLGIADLYAEPEQEEKKKKTTISTTRPVPRLPPRRTPRLESPQKCRPGPVVGCSEGVGAPPPPRAPPAPI